MSLEAITWAFKQDIKGPAKMVLVCLADHTNQDNECWPSQALLAEKSGYSRSTVNLSLKRLEEGHFIARKRRFREKGGKDKTVYIMYISEQISEQDQCPADGHRNVQQTDNPCPGDGQPNVLAPDMNIINPQLEPSEEPNRRTSLQEAYQLWNDLAEEIETIPKARIVQGPAQDDLKARLRVGGIEGFKLALAGIRKSPHHQNKRNWNGMNLGWMVETPKKYERMQNLADAPDEMDFGNATGNSRNGNGMSISEKDNAATGQAFRMLQDQRRLQ